MFKDNALTFDEEARSRWTLEVELTLGDELPVFLSSCYHTRGFLLDLTSDSLMLSTFAHGHGLPDLDGDVDKSLGDIDRQVWRCNHVWPTKYIVDVVKVEDEAL